MTQINTSTSTMLHSLVTIVADNFRIVLLLIFSIVALTLAPTANVPNKEVVAKVENIAKMVDPKQLTCLAHNIYYEAGSEPVQGMAAVARVVVNRVNHGFASTPCEVVYQVMRKPNEDGEGHTKVCQFSWVCEGKKNPNTKDPRYQQSMRVAYDVLANDAYKHVIPTTTLFFHNLTVDPIWPYKQVAKIGNHIFYEKIKKKSKKTIYKAEPRTIIAENDQN